MTKKDKLYDKARLSPRNLKFNELIKLAEQVGYVKRDQTGSHAVYRHPVTRDIQNFQPCKKDKSKAKDYQIKQLLNAIEKDSLK